jgi:DNA-binding protein H-NS
MSEQVVESTVTETPEAIKAPESPQESNLSDTFQRIAKQESFVKSERAKIEEARKAFEADKEDISKYRSLKEKNPFEILEHFGISYDKLLQADKDRQNPIDPMVKKALDAVEQLKGELNSEKEKVVQERRSKAEIKLQADIAQVIKTHEFDLIEKLEAKDSVREYMEEMYATTGEIPDVKEACEAVTERLAARFMSVKDSKWLKPKEAPVPERATESNTETQKNHTISNKMTQSSVGTDKPMTESERFKAALQAMNTVSR